MNRIYWLAALIAGLFVISGCRGARENLSSISLVDEISYAYQSAFAGRGDAFQPAVQQIGGKRYPALLQSLPGSIRFHFQLEQHPVLQFTLMDQKRRDADLEAEIVAESDYPSPLIRRYPAIPGKTQSVDLSEFEGRMTAVSLISRRIDLTRLGGQVFWIDPVLLQVSPERKAPQPDPGTYRKRHKGKNVMILLMDATNAEHLGCYGYARPTSPTIDSLAKEGIVWESAFSTVPSTLASTGSLFTGYYPAAHGVLRKPDALPASFKTMAEFFREAGYQTAMFTGNPNASPAFGYGQGFDYAWVPRLGRPTNADDFLPEVTSWLNRLDQKPFFAYIHFREPHWPYRPPREFLARFLEHPDLRLPESHRQLTPEMKEQTVGAYDANIAFVDFQIGKILKELQNRNLWEDTIVAVIADHGEAFWEHGRQGHNYSLFDEFVRIPLILRIPGETGLHGIRKTDLVSSMDLLPTFLDLFGFTRKGYRGMGQSLLPRIFAKEKSDSHRLLLSQTVYARAYALRSESFKYIRYERAGEEEDDLFDLTSDPKEDRNQISVYPIVASYYRVQMKKLLDESRAISKQVERSPDDKAVLDEEVEDELRALGYIN